MLLTNTPQYLYPHELCSWNTVHCDDAVVTLANILSTTLCKQVIISILHTWKLPLKISRFPKQWSWALNREVHLIAGSVLKWCYSDWNEWLGTYRSPQGAPPEFGNTTRIQLRVEISKHQDKKKNTSRLSKITPRMTYILLWVQGASQIWLRRSGSLGSNGWDMADENIAVLCCSASETPSSEQDHLSEKNESKSVDLVLSKVKITHLP